MRISSPRTERPLKQPLRLGCPSELLADLDVLARHAAQRLDHVGDAVLDLLCKRSIGTHQLVYVLRTRQHTGRHLRVHLSVEGLALISRHVFIGEAVGVPLGS